MAVLKLLSVAAVAIFLSDTDWACATISENGSESDTNSKSTLPEDDGEDLEEEQPEIEDDGGSPDATNNTAERVKCWEQMNVARSAAGFAEFTQHNMFKIGEENGAEPQNVAEELKTYLAKVCEGIKTNQKPGDLTAPIEGTFAYAVQDGTTADCQAAVDYWKDAFTNFKGELPPAYEANTTPYNDTQNVSFISLFNPQDAPKVDCAYFTCPASAGGGEKQKQGTGEDKEMKALICATTPEALKAGEQPFKQEQWNKITVALSSGSTVGPVPTFLALAAAALAAVFF
ncbi:SAG family member [Eimeria mitis]|uniref:SAG family member n=1 Tax=Eimeria mitis TaxID=44415 RepID=U6K5D1_9EIME|nr:SAG family member [Eimeria mitis]CDJ32934.1 SAG family member [Eimeria mitis]